ncbi:MAG: beta-propeller fold lactonase family protein [Burkholderiales bacterium]|nr:beta-propeller fold lactonase family protein [Burkholderiales bacterium]MDE2277385.1 beta-propeller fold lactonase family protein [Burkholderiales bacterium]
MHTFFRTTALALCSSFVLVAASLPAGAAEAAPARVTFDGQIRNNSLALSPDESTAVASYSERPDLIVYDLVTGAVRGVLRGYVTPRNIVFAPDGKSFYVSDSSLGTVTRLDTATLKPLAAASTLAAGPGAFGTALSKDGSSLYVNNQASSTVTRLDTASGQAKVVITGFAQPRQGVRLSPDGTKLYVTNFLGDKVTIVDTQTDKIEGEITGFNKIRAISVTADGKTLFAANSGSNDIAVVDIGARRVTGTVPVGRDPYGAALTPDGRFVYSGNLADNTVSVIDVATLKVVATIAGFKQPRQAIVFTRDGQTAYVLNEDLSISKVERAGRRIVTTLAAPQAVAAY